MSGAASSCRSTHHLTGSYGVPAFTLAEPTVLFDDAGEPVRLEPRSRLEFEVDGEWTPPVAAGALLVDGDAILVPTQEGAPPRRILQTDITGLRVDNLDGPKSYALTVGATVLVAAALLYALAAMGGDDEDDDDDDDDDDDNESEEREGRGKAAAPASKRKARPVAAPVADPDDPTEGTAGDALVFAIEATQDMLALARAIERNENEAALERTEGPQPLFLPSAKRRSEMIGVFVVSGGVAGFSDPVGFTGDVAFGLRFVEAFELMGGVRGYGGQRADEDDGAALFGFGRISGHYTLDAYDDWGAPIGVDVAFGEEGFQQVRVVWGVRYRFSRFFEVQLHPLNPQLTRIDKKLFWDAPSSLQMGVRF